LLLIGFSSPLLITEFVQAQISEKIYIPIPSHVKISNSQGSQCWRLEKSFITAPFDMTVLDDTILTLNKYLIPELKEHKFPHYSLVFTLPVCALPYRLQQVFG